MTAVTDMTSMPAASPAVRKTPKATFDIVFRNASFLAALLVLVLLAGIMVSMVVGGWPAFREFGLGFITSSVWDTQNEQYGAWPAIVGTLSTALIALVIGVPLSLGIAVFLTQLAPPWFKKPVATAIELLAAVPSIIYGMWGLFVFAPLFAQYVQIPLSNLVEGMPIVGTVLYSRSPSGLGIFTAGIILAFMIVPFIASITRDMLEQIPRCCAKAPTASARRPGRWCAMCWCRRRASRSSARSCWAGPRSRRDHGGDLRRRQCQPALRLDPRSGLDHRLAHRQRVQRGAGPAAQRADRAGCILFFVTFVVLVVARLLVARVKKF